jgi:hypothetical protein
LKHDIISLRLAGRENYVDASGEELWRGERSG